MKKHSLIITIPVFTVLFGCNLASPPDCHTNQDKCINDDIGSGIYYICGNDGQWGSPTACKSSCNGNTCAEFDNTRACTKEGESQCLTYNDNNISLLCFHNQWIITPCMGTCEDNQCINSETKCTDGDKQCIFVESLNISIESECKNNQWISRYCPNGVSCDENHCAPPPFIECTESNGTPCQGKQSWSHALCQDGQCVPDKCRDTYLLSNGDCFAQSECCGKDCVNCKAQMLVCTEDGQCESPDNCFSPKMVCNGVCIHQVYCDSAPNDIVMNCNSCAETINGWKQGTCPNGRCIPTACLDG